MVLINQLKDNRGGSCCMRKYTSKSQKIDLYSAKYNISKEEVNRILSEHEDVLTLEELKIKYDNPNIGKLPEWLSEETLDLMIWKTVHQYWSPLFQQRMTKEELYSEHQEYIRKKINLFENVHHVKAALVKRMLFLVDEYTRKGKYFLGSTDEQLPADNLYGSVRYKYELPIEDTKNIESDLFIEQIRNIKNKSIKSLLIITGYLLCDITEFRKDYIEILRSSDEEVKMNLQKLEETLEHNEELDLMKYSNIVVNERKKSINIKDIIKALRLNIIDNKKEKVDNTLEEIRYYLKCIGIA